jgi:hypothetical protein
MARKETAHPSRSQSMTRPPLFDVISFDPEATPVARTRIEFASAGRPANIVVRPINWWGTVRHRLNWPSFFFSNA